MSDPSIWVDNTLHGEPARWLLEWKRRDLVKNNRDAAVVHSFRIMHERIVSEDLKEAKLKTLGRSAYGGISK